MGDLEFRKLCERFAVEWQQHINQGTAAPDICELVFSTDLAGRDELLMALLPIEIRSRIRMGQQPAADEYRLKFPDQDQAVTRVFDQRLRNAETIAPEPAGNEVLANTGPDDKTIFLSTKTDRSASSPRRGAPQLGELFGDYEIEEEIARGGMGVVFRARQTKLNRQCALKMILSGHLASDLEVQRFYAEAEAAAHLEHPGIVPIYEIGEQDGQHFFSMKFIDGGSLADRLDELQSDPRRAVQLVESVSRAVHHAHQRGILHRDLKPANILMNAEGQPLVSDLGLAKHTGVDSGMTRTGAIVGTPAYMSPEQAAGKPDITTVADIYSLGAILYELLTGVPPHQGDTPMDTILKVLNESPDPVRRINPAIDRDLELICHKCLAADPAERYSSAGALADDLHNWLDGKPISLRPPTAASRFTEWLKDNLRSVGGAALVGAVCGICLGVTVWLVLADDSFGPMFEVYDLLPSEPRPLLALNVDMAGWITAQLAWVILPPIILVGLLTALVTRPESRSASIALGTVAGLTMSIVAYATGIGWAPIVQFTEVKSMEDVRLLGTAAAEDPGTRERALRTLRRKYPDLRNYPVDQQGTIVANKTIADGTTGIPIALWLSMLATLTCCMAPAVFGTVFAGSLLRRRTQGWRTVLLYLEVASLFAMVSVFFVLNYLAKTMGANIIVPPLIYQLALYLTASLAIWAALTRRDGRVRNALHLLWMVALAMYLLEVNRTAHTFEIANQMVAEGQLEDAAVRYERLVANNPGNVKARYYAAMVQARLENFPRYRAHCRAMIDRFERTSNPYSADQAAKVCLIKPESLPDLSPAYDLADVAVIEGVNTTSEEFFFVLRALSAWRQGEFAEVSVWIDRIESSRARFLAETADLLRGMARYQLEPTAENRSKLTDAITAAANAMQVFRMIRRDYDQVVNGLVMEILASEAQSLLDPGPASVPQRH